MKVSENNYRRYKRAALLASFLDRAAELVKVNA